MIQATDGIKTYLREISRNPVLTREEEVELFTRLRESGDPAARERILQCNLRLVVRIAQLYQNKGLSMEDLIQEGNVGLLDVIERFDPTLGFRFSTYAAFWIKQAMQVAIRRQSSIIRIPVRKARMLGRLNDIFQEFYSMLGRAPTAADLAERLGISEDQIEDLLRLARSCVSLDMPLDEDGSTLQDRLADEMLMPPAENSMKMELESRIWDALAQLSMRENSILRMRFGLDGQEPRSLRNVSKRVGLSQEGVRRVEQRALAKLGRNGFRRQLAGLL